MLMGGTCNPRTRTTSWWNVFRYAAFHDIMSEKSVTYLFTPTCWNERKRDSGKWSE
jgi:hypothetical protein